MVNMLKIILVINLLYGKNNFLYNICTRIHNYNELFNLNIYQNMY